MFGLFHILNGGRYRKLDIWGDPVKIQIADLVSEVQSRVVATGLEQSIFYLSIRLRNS